MEADMGLLLVILTAAHSMESYCDGRQDGAQCYAAVGGSVIIQLMDDASEIFRYEWLKQNSVILVGRKDRILFNFIENQSSFTPSNGTFRINNLSRSDGGGYALTTFDSVGNVSKRTLQLIIQAPVSSVLLVPECLSQGELRVSCSSEGGDSPQYSWTLDGRTLTDAELLSGNAETTSITLKQHVSGQLVCSVRNNVSHVSKEERISTCGINSLTTVSTINTVPEASTGDNSLLICGVRAAVVILALIGIVGYFAWKKKKYKMAEGSAVSQQREHQENSVMMVDMRSSISEH